MSSQSPYSPPKSPVRDVAAPSKIERRVLRDLARLLEDEPRRLRSIRTWARILLALGCCATAWTWLFIGDTGAVTWLALLAVVGGFFLGSSFFLHNSLTQWPTTRKYLDADRIRADYEASKTQAD